MLRQVRPGQTLSDIFQDVGLSLADLQRVMDAAGLRALQQLVRRLPVGESVVEAILELVRSARPGAAAVPVIVPP